MAKDGKIQLLILDIPLAFDSHDPWMNLFHAMCLRYGEQNQEDHDTIPAEEQLDRRIQQLKEAVLTDYGLHLKV